MERTFGFVNGNAFGQIAASRREAHRDAEVTLGSGWFACLYPAHWLPKQAYAAGGSRRRDQGDCQPSDANKCGPLAVSGIRRRERSREARDCGGPSGVASLCLRRDTMRDPGIRMRSRRVRGDVMRARAA